MTEQKRPIPQTLVAQLCDADLRNTNPAIGMVGEFIPIEIMPTMQYVEYMNAVAECGRMLFDAADWQHFSTKAG